MKQIDIPPVIRSEKACRTIGNILVPSKAHFADPADMDTVRFLRALSVAEGPGIDYLSVFVVNADEVSQIPDIVQQAVRMETDRKDRACLARIAKNLANALTVTSPLAGLYLKTPDGQATGLYFQETLHF